MRTPWLLASIFFHSAAVSVALLVGVCGPVSTRPPVARIEIRNAPPSAPAHVELRQTPDVEPEAVDVVEPLVDLDLPPEERPEPEPAIDPAPLPASPSSVLAKVSSERLRSPAPPTEPPVEPPVEPVEAPLPAAPSQPAFTAATRSDQGGPPLYPEKLRLRGREGTVVLRITVLADGSVADVSLKTPSRYAGFNRAALRAARGWRFEPATEAGVPVDSDTDVEVVFSLTESAGGRR